MKSEGKRGPNDAPLLDAANALRLWRADVAFQSSDVLAASMTQSAGSPERKAAAPKPARTSGKTARAKR
jgi:hypothetical protein